MNTKIEEVNVHSTEQIMSAAIYEELNGIEYTVKVFFDLLKNYAIYSYLRELVV